MMIIYTSKCLPFSPLSSLLPFFNAAADGIIISLLLNPQKERVSSSKASEAKIQKTQKKIQIRERERERDMATTASDSQVIMRQPQLIDIVDEAWAQDKLSDDGTYFFFQFFSSIDSYERRAQKSWCRTSWTTEMRIAILIHVRTQYITYYKSRRIFT